MIQGHDCMSNKQLIILWRGCIYQTPPPCNVNFSTVYPWFIFSFPSPWLVAVSWIKSSHCPTILPMLYTPYSFSYFINLSGSLVLNLRLLQVILGLLGICVHFCSYKWAQRLCFIFDFFIYTNSYVNRTAGEIAIFGVRSLRCTGLLSY